MGRPAVPRGRGRLKSGREEGGKNIHQENGQSERVPQGATNDALRDPRTEMAALRRDILPAGAAKLGTAAGKAKEPTPVAVLREEGEEGAVIRRKREGNTETTAPSASASAMREGRGRKLTSIPQQKKTWSTIVRRKVLKKAKVINQSPTVPSKRSNKRKEEKKEDGQQENERGSAALCE